jgi:hypothetical protein
MHGENVAGLSLRGRIASLVSFMDLPGASV